MRARVSAGQRGGRRAAHHLDVLRRGVRAVLDVDAARVRVRERGVRGGELREEGVRAREDCGRSVRVRGRAGRGRTLGGGVDGVGGAVAEVEGGGCGGRCVVCVQLFEDVFWVGGSGKGSSRDWGWSVRMRRCRSSSSSTSSFSIALFLPLDEAEFMVGKI